MNMFEASKSHLLCFCNSGCDGPTGILTRNLIVGTYAGIPGINTYFDKINLPSPNNVITFAGSIGWSSPIENTGLAIWKLNLCTHDYKIKAGMYLQGSGDGGIVFRYNDSENFYYVTAKAYNDGIARTNGCSTYFGENDLGVRLYKRVNGVDTLLEQVRTWGPYASQEFWARSRYGVFTNYTLPSKTNQNYLEVGVEGNHIVVTAKDDNDSYGYHTNTFQGNPLFNSQLINPPIISVIDNDIPSGDRIGLFVNKLVDGSGAVGFTTLYASRIKQASGIVRYYKEGLQSGILQDCHIDFHPGASFCYNPSGYYTSNKLDSLRHRNFAGLRTPDQIKLSISNIKGGFNSNHTVTSGQFNIKCCDDCDNLNGDWILDKAYQTPTASYWETCFPPLCTNLDSGDLQPFSVQFEGPGTPQDAPLNKLIVEFGYKSDNLTHYGTFPYVGGGGAVPSYTNIDLLGTRNPCWNVYIVGDKIDKIGNQQSLFGYYPSYIFRDSGVSLTCTGSFVLNPNPKLFPLNLGSKYNVNDRMRWWRDYSYNPLCFDGRAQSWYMVKTGEYDAPNLRDTYIEWAAEIDTIFVATGAIWSRPPIPPFIGSGNQTLYNRATYDWCKGEVLDILEPPEWVTKLDGDCDGNRPGKNWSDITCSTTGISLTITAL